MGRQSLKLTPVQRQNQPAAGDPSRKTQVSIGSCTADFSCVEKFEGM
jgi:hypothetical protein